MAQSDNEDRQSDLSHTPQGVAPSDPSDRPGRDQQAVGQGDDRQWTLRRIEGVIGSIA